MAIPSLPAQGAPWMSYAQGLDTEARTIAGKQDKATLGADVAADATVRAAYVPKWKPNTAYTSGEFVLNPSGQTVSANTSFTSGATYSGSNWTVVSASSSVPDATLTVKGIVELATTTETTTGTDAVRAVTPAGVKAATDALAAVARSGAYSDLSGTPTIPAAYTDELARDALGIALVAGAGIAKTVNDAADTIRIDADPTAEYRRGLIPPTPVGIVLTRGTAGAWDAGIVESAVVRWDPKQQRLAMTYVGYDSPNVHAQTGLAWSDDNGLTWTKDAANPIFTYSGVPGAVDENGTTGPVWYYDITTDLYYLWYIGLTGTGYEQGTKRLCYATAPALTGPWTRQGAIISPTGTGWRATSIYHADPVEVRGVKYLFFNAKGGDGKEYIGYATSSSGTWAGPWTVDDTNSPLLSPGTSGAWDDNKVGDPCVYRVGVTWYMAYYGYNLTNDVAQDGVAWTTDAMFPLGPSGGAWTKFAGNPVLSPGGIQGDTKYAAKPYIRRTTRRLSHFYSALSTGGVREIALAIDPDDRETEAVGISEYTTPITTTSTAYVGITPSTWLQNGTGRKKMQVRFHARVNAATTTITLRDHNYPGALATAVGNVGYQVVTSTWADIPDGSGALSSYCEWKATAAVTITISNLVWEFRWVNP